MWRHCSEKREAMGKWEPGILGGLAEGFQGCLEVVGWLFFLHALLRDPRTAPSGPHLLYCLLLNHQYREKQITVCSSWLHRSEGETVRSRGSLFCSYSHWNYEVSIAVGPISAEGFTKERWNFPHVPNFSLWNWKHTHSDGEGEGCSSAVSCTDLSASVLSVWGRPYQDLVP